MLTIAQASAFAADLARIGDAFVSSALEAEKGASVAEAAQASQMLTNAMIELCSRVTAAAGRMQRLADTNRN